MGGLFIMKNLFKKPKTIIISALIAFLLICAFYIIGSKYIFYKNTLSTAMRGNYIDLITNCQENINLSETILKEGKIEKYEALLYEQRFGNICKLTSDFTNIFHKNDSNSDYSMLLLRIGERPVGKNFAVFTNNDSRELTDDDITFLKSKIKICQAILNASSSLDKENKNISFDYQDYFNWFNNVSNNVSKLSMTDLYS